MPKITFNILEFFGLLGVGFLCLQFAMAFGGVPRFETASPGATGAALVVLVSYIVGSLVSSVAELTLERLVVTKYLGRPEDILLSEERSRGTVTVLFGQYFKVVPVGVKVRLVAQMDSRQIPDDPQSRFHHARQIAKDDERTWSRLETFQGLFVFSRNAAFALLIMGVVAFGYLVPRGLSSTPMASFYLIGAVGMFYRYIKFYRLYSYELFCAYPDLVIRTRNA
jgi:hypothetical protein